MGSPQVKNYPSNSQNFLFALTWVICGILAVLVPLVYRTVKKNQYENMYYMYNWEEAQQQYQEQQQEYNEQMEQNQYGYYNNGGQYNNAANYQYQWEQMSGDYDVNQCKWYQFNCFPYYINERGEPEPRAGWYPSWFSGWAVSQEEKYQMMENGETSSAMMFVYIWQIIMFVTIIVYGYIVIRQNRVITGVLVALVVYANMSFLSMWMLADGSIVTDGELVQQTGFYGQFSVLMFITNAWYIIFGIVFACLFAIRGHHMHDEQVYRENQKLQQNAESYREMENA